MPSPMVHAIAHCPCRRPAPVLSPIVHTIAAHRLHHRVLLALLDIQDCRRRHVVALIADLTWSIRQSMSIEYRFLARTPDVASHTGLHETTQRTASETSIAMGGNRCRTFGQPRRGTSNEITVRGKQQCGRTCLDGTRGKGWPRRGCPCSPRVAVARRLVCSPPTKVNLVLIPGRVTPGFSHAAIVPDDVASRRVSAEISCIPYPFIPALLSTHLTSLSSALKTSLLRAVQISPLVCVGKPLLQHHVVVSHSSHLALTPGGKPQNPQLTSMSTTFTPEVASLTEPVLQIYAVHGQMSTFESPAQDLLACMLCNLPPYRSLYRGQPLTTFARRTHNNNRHSYSPTHSQQLLRQGYRLRNTSRTDDCPFTMDRMCPQKEGSFIRGNAEVIGIALQALLKMRIGLETVSKHTNLLTNSHCDNRAEHPPRRRHRGANARPSDYKSATLPLSYEGRPTCHSSLVHGLMKQIDRSAKLGRRPGELPEVEWRDLGWLLKWLPGRRNFALLSLAPKSTRKNPPTSGIVRHDSHMRKSMSDPAGNRARFAWVGFEAPSQDQRIRLISEPGPLSQPPSFNYHVLTTLPPPSPLFAPLAMFISPPPLP
ncbi:hypothetical protein PR048_012436 [Dryococelus australis]|uniref:Uncharacterized protein n=1 Tax=Dryococelus australis TaxID=614101 RepID=A0ABQ9HPH1_9NEOP|nr:hypothetical protein PR048_012436 [Dryococelus australis]